MEDALTDPMIDSDGRKLIMNAGPYGESLYLKPFGDGWGMAIDWELPDGTKHTIRLGRGHANELSQSIQEMLEGKAD